MIENHSLANEFPEFKEQIHQLKTSSAHFAKLFDEYHLVDKQIHRIEQGIENTSDEFLEDLKKQRLHKKDALYVILQQS